MTVFCLAWSYSKIKAVDRSGWQKNGILERDRALAHMLVGQRSGSHAGRCHRASCHKVMYLLVRVDLGPGPDQHT